MPSKKSVPRTLLIFCFFLSGAAGLLFEVVWVRHLTLSLGHTTLAISVVLTAFMTGLAIGGYVGGKHVDAASSRQLVSWYALCEGGIGILGVLSYFLIRLSTVLVPHIDLWFQASFLKHLTWFLISFVPLLGPTILMGATLPIMSRWLHLESKMESSGNSVGLAYGANTLGAVLGTFVAGFFLIPVLGLTKCYFIAALVNLSAAGAAVTGARFARALRPETTVPPRPIEPNKKRQTAALLFLTGAAAMICQVAWTRLFSLVIGSSTYAFSIILIVFLIGLSIGSLLYRTISKLVKPGWNNLWFLLFLLGAGLLTYLPMFNKLPYYFSELFQFTRGPNTMFVLHFLLCSMVMLLPTMAMGMILPWAFDAFDPAKNTFGKALGFAYLANTTGAIAGSAGAGLLLIPYWGAEKSIVCAVWLYVLALLVVVASDTERMTSQKIKLAAGTLLLFGLGTGLRPPLDPAVLSSGAFLYAPDYFRKNSFQEFLDDVRTNRILFHEDGVSSTVTVLESPWGVRFLRVNGKTDASSTTDMATQLLQGYLARLTHSGSPKRALVIGLGSGATTGALTTDIGIQQIDCVEIEPAIQKTLPYFTEVNRNLAENPRVRIIPTDGRHFLEATAQTYDIISSEPSNPWIAGVSNLFTKEAFEAVRDKLADDGVFCQWFHSYSMGLEDFQMVLRTFAEVFPHVILFTSGEKDYFLLGSKKQWDIDYKHLEDLFETNIEMRKDLAVIGFAHPFSLLASTFLLDDADFRSFCANSPLHLDDKPTLEFSAPRYLHRGEDTLILAAIMQSKKEFLPTGFRGLVTDNAGWSSLYNMAGESFMRLRQLQQAEDAFDKAMSKTPGDPRTWVNQGRVFIMKQEHLKAEQAFRRALAANPKYALAHFHLGMLYLDQGLEDASIRSLENGLALAPGDPMGSLQLGRLYLSRGNKSAAKTVAETALKYPIKNVDLYNSLIRFLSALKEKPSQKI